MNIANISLKKDSLRDSHQKLKDSHLKKLTIMILNILFVINRCKVNSKGICSLQCRLTYNKNRKTFSTGLFVNPDYWNSKKQKVLKDAEQSEFITTQLSLIKTNLNQAFLMLQIQKKSFDVDDIFKIYNGENLIEDTKIVEYFKVFLKKLEKLVGKDLEEATFKKYDKVSDHIASFVKWKYRKKDILVSAIESSFLDDLEYYLKTEKNHKQVTINKILQRFKRVVNEAFNEKIIDRNPFVLHKYKKVKKQVIFLTSDELKEVENFNFSQNRLEQVRDCFVFCCYTGLAYNEMSNLVAKDLITEFDGQLWIKTVRKKTSKIVSVPLLPKALDIIKNYAIDGQERLLPNISNQKFNSYLKEIAEIVGIDKRLTHHTARKTFASTVLLYNNVPMEIVSELLGHSNMAITQAHYGKVVQKKVSEEMKKLNKKLTS